MQVFHFRTRFSVGQISEYTGRRPYEDNSVDTDWQRVEDSFLGGSRSEGKKCPFSNPGDKKIKKPTHPPPSGSRKLEKKICLGKRSRFP